jgi:kynurenine 3-monooxygenase
MGRVIVVGAGLVGALLSILLSKRGCEVEVFERLPDLRQSNVVNGRAINLTLCQRGYSALDCAGVGDIVRGLSVPVYGRMIHSVKGDLTFQPYGENREAIYSIMRNDLNRALLDYAELQCGVNFRFREKCLDVDLSGISVQMTNSGSGLTTQHTGDRVFGADGAHSVVRQHLQRASRFDYVQRYWEQGYKELSVPANAGHAWTEHRNALHLWPRRDYMLIGFPNLDGSFTCSLHLPYEGNSSFASITTSDALIDFFNGSFPDAVEAMPSLVEDFFSSQPSSMLTIKCSPWTHGNKLALVGDAVHSILPSYGQGANAGFEDCEVIYHCMEEYGDDWGRIFQEYESRRRPNTDAIADLCIEHFSELRDRVGDPKFILRKEIERKLTSACPELYQDLYYMITFTPIPYAEALRRNQAQTAIVDQILDNYNLSAHTTTVEGTNLIDKLIQERLAETRLSAKKLASTLSPLHH